MDEIRKNESKKKIPDLWMPGFIQQAWTLKKYIKLNLGSRVKP